MARKSTKKATPSAKKTTRLSKRASPAHARKPVHKAGLSVRLSRAAGEMEGRRYSSGDVQPARLSQAPVFQEVTGELPRGYGDHFIYLMVRDPYWLYAYWEIQKHREAEALQQLGGRWEKVRSILRLYRLSLDPGGHTFRDIRLVPGAENWFLDVEANQDYVVEIGLLHEDGRFIALARSNQITTPRMGMSDVLDEEWMSIDFDKMYALSGGFEVGRSSAALSKLMEERLRSAITSGASSGGRH